MHVDELLDAVFHELDASKTATNAFYLSQRWRERVLAVNSLLRREKPAIAARLASHRGWTSDLEELVKAARGLIIATETRGGQFGYAAIIEAICARIVAAAQDVIDESSLVAMSADA